MDILIKQSCKRCGKELKELSVNVMTEIQITWNNKMMQYEPSGGCFDLNKVNEYFCPTCHFKNIIDPKLINILSSELIKEDSRIESRTGKCSLTSFIKK
jgi:hypothetical protein